MTQLDHLSLLATLQGEFLTLARAADPEAPVPWCGRWRVRNVVEHLARIHHWAAGQARRAQEPPLGRGPFDLPELYASCAAELRETLAELGPDADAWTLVGRGPVSFWHRRQVHETLVHLWDLRAAVATAAGPAPTSSGRAPHGIGLVGTDDVAPQVWADTVEEVVDVMHPRQVSLGRVPRLAGQVTLVATDVDLRRTLEHAEREGGAVEVHGPAAALALLVWGRIDADHPGLRVVGDRPTLDQLLAAGLTP